ncbi:uroporphyrinogen-III C-methyltransferase [Cellulophaga omnivescoria]|uniref:uroporphyrinogen-III C-methyltransferase n=1 Tax=Cellulophaga omnivescoria TaxID=1888890 RepID=UPI0022F007F9|nr:uroporphyrinogen-III C-methyltransferase [Cellulophaga omnivescoria]WBU90124.1 uroporphyrinogen-III C-methyltransferase [Cellulophaga omnivescoria]
MMQSKNPKVSLVGAGPGGVDLITLRGIKVLQQADVILYDALVSIDLLSEIDNSIPKIYVGKRCGKHSLLQGDINKLIVESAYKYGHVVRLKGGDPFVFGRASEEIEYVESFGIPVTVVPGISSAIAVPASQGIPVTRRGVSSSFWVMTATKKDGSFSNDLILAAKSSATLVILMGVRKFIKIAQEVAKHRSKLTPFAIIQNGTLGKETCITGTLSSCNTVKNNINIALPGVIVIGDVVAEHPSFFEEELQRVLHSSL